MNFEVVRPVSESITTYRMSMEVVQVLVEEFSVDLREMVLKELDARSGKSASQMLTRIEKLTRHLKNVECEKYGFPPHHILTPYLDLAAICGVYYRFMKEELALARKNVGKIVASFELPEIAREFVHEMEKLSHISGTITDNRFSFFYPESLFILDALVLDSLGCVGILNHSVVCHKLQMEMFDQHQKLIYHVSGDDEPLMRKPSLIDVIKDECNRSEGEMNTMAGEYERKRRVSHMHYFIQGLQTDIKEFDEQIDWESSDNVTKNLFPM